MKSVHYFVRGRDEIVIKMPDGTPRRRWGSWWERLLGRDRIGYRWTKPDGSDCKVSVGRRDLQAVIEYENIPEEVG